MPFGFPLPVAPNKPSDEANLHIWRAPLVPIALAATVGIVLDRNFQIPLGFSLIGASASVFAWAVTRSARQPGLPLLYLALGVMSLGAAYQHWCWDVYAADDIGNFATAELHPVQVRGLLDEEPAIMWQPPNLGLQSVTRDNPTVAVLRVSQLKQGDEWQPASGRARLIVAGSVDGLHAGDEVEVVGRLSLPHGAGNPGEVDSAAVLRGQRMRAQIIVAKTADGVTRLSQGWSWSLHGWLAVLRGWGQRQLRAALPPEQSGIATAMLLGDGAELTSDDWQKYIRTGVIHVLVISGQHLVILAFVLWRLVQLLGVRRSRSAWFVALFLLGYALLTGGRPPILRAAVMVCVSCAALVLHRPVLRANALALAWLVVAALNPAHIFDPGCQLSFLSVVVLFWGPRRWFRPSQDPLARLVERSRPRWQQLLRGLGRKVAVAYAVTAVMWLALDPLVAGHYHLVAPVGLLIAPLALLLMSIVLVSGFHLLLAAAVCPPLVPLFAWPTQVCIAACEFLVNASDQVPHSHVYLGHVPDWWLWIFYLLLLAALTQPLLWQRWRWCGLAGIAWLCLGLLGGAARLPSEELRCTFLAVGHGGCTVLETPDGRTLLYDAGALTGPEVTRRQIAPFLWSRGIHRIDEVFLSHADLDHFNGLPALLDRFAIGQVTCTPTFADKSTQAVHLTLAALERQRIPIRIVYAGQRLVSGSVTIDVLHPLPPRPGIVPEGNENARSMVLLIEHAGHRLLLTGDLESPGLERVLAMPPVPVDVLMAPHHGSRVSNKPELAAWARPKVVVSCEGPPHGRIRAEEPYTAAGALFLGTWPHGAVTVHSHESGLVVETFVTGQRFVVRRGGGEN